MSRNQPVMVQKRMSFLSSVVWGVCSVLIVTVVCASGIVFYGMRLVEVNGYKAIEMVENTLGDMPEVIAAVPMLEDIVSNRRSLEYADSLDISVAFQEHSRHSEYLTPVVKVVNNGTELVAFMGLRVVVSDERGRLVMEHSEYIATPLHIDDELPGPLAPGSTRRLTLGSFRRVDNPTAEFEIPELRVWVQPGAPRAAPSADGLLGGLSRASDDGL